LINIKGNYGSKQGEKELAKVEKEPLLSGALQLRWEDPVVGI